MSTIIILILAILAIVFLVQHPILLTIFVISLIVIILLYKVYGKKSTVEKITNDGKQCKKIAEVIQNNYDVKINDTSETFWERRFEDIKDKTERSYPSKNGLKIPEIMVLNYAKSFDSTGETIQSFWYYKYGLKDAKEILDKLLEQGFICISPIQDTIKRFSNAKLKDMLKELNLKVSGKKSELLERLFQNTTIEYLENKVEARGFSITEKGEQELKDNAYVMYFHNGRALISSPDINVWWVNKKLHEYPQKTYREIIWEELQKQYKIHLREIHLKGYYPYTNICNEICRFLLEVKGNAEIALKYCAESAYYNINCCMLKEYNEQIEYKDTDSVLEIHDYVYLDELSFKNIQEELNISDNDIIKKLENIFISFNVDKPLLSDTETAKFIVAKIKKDYDTLDNINYIM